MGQEHFEAGRSLGFEIRNPQRFAHNMARLSEEAGKAAAVFLHPRAINLTHFTLHDDLAPALKTLSQLQQAWLQQPHKVLEAQVVLWNNCLELWHSSMCRLMGLENGDVRPLAVSLPEDPRFQHPAWSENPYFDLLRQSYLITSHWAEALVDTADDLDPHTRNKARFYLTQIKRLHYIIEGSQPKGLDCTLYCLHTADHYNDSMGRHFLHMGDHFQAAHAWHSDITDNQFKGIVAQPGKSFFCRTGRRAFVVGG